jgi:membrane protein implicated in regulation of membrane protease activity
MTVTLWWTLIIIVGLVIANLWLLRRNKKLQQQKPQREIRQKKTAEGAVTGTIVAGSGTDGSRIKQVDTDHHHSASDGGSDSSGSSGD